MASKASLTNFLGIDPSGMSITFIRVGSLIFLCASLQILAGCTSGSIGSIASRPGKELPNAEQSIGRGVAPVLGYSGFSGL